MSKSLTAGKPWRVILIFAIPLLIGNVVQQMYQVIDAVVVGRNLGVDALAAVGSTGGIFFLLIGFSWGMTTGFAIPTAQAFGAEDPAAVRRSVAAGTTLTALTGLAVTAIGVLSVRAFLQLLQTPASLLEEATTFATVSFSGALAIMFFNYLSAILRARGDSTTPLVFLIISSVVNMGLVLLFVRYLGLGVGGAAGATVSAQALSVVLCLIYIYRAVPALRVSKADLLACGPDMMPHLRLGLPMGFQTSIIAIGALAVQVRLNLLGPEAVAAYTTAMRVDGLATAFLASLGLAASTFVAQNYGARLFDRIRVGIRQSLAIGIATALLLAFLLITFGTVFVRAFVGTGNDEVVGMAHSFLVINGSFYWVVSILFITRGGLQGIGRMTIPTLSGVLELALRVAAAVFLGGLFGFVGVAWASPLAWIGATLLLVPAWLRALKRLRARTDGCESEDEVRAAREVDADRSLGSSLMPADEPQDLDEPRVNDGSEVAQFPDPIQPSLNEVIEPDLKEKEAPCTCGH